MLHSCSGRAGFCAMVKSGQRFQWSHACQYLDRILWNYHQYLYISLSSGHMVKCPSDGHGSVESLDIIHDHVWLTCSKREMYEECISMHRNNNTDLKILVEIWGIPHKLVRKSGFLQDWLRITVNKILTCCFIYH